MAPTSVLASATSRARKAARLLQVETILPLGPKGQRKLGGIPPAPLAEPHALLGKALNEPVTWNGEPPALNEKGLYGSRRFMFKGHKWERQLPEREQNLHDFKVKYDEKRAATEFRQLKFERRADRKRREGGLLQ